MVKILIALDGSGLSEMALLHGKAIAHAFESELVLVRVLPTEERDLRASIDAIDWQVHRCQVEAYLQRHTNELKATGLNASWVLEEGNVAERLICYSKTNHIDLIVLGALGRSGTGHFARGGTAQKIISAATTSVLIAPPWPDHAPQPTELAYERILVPVDGSCGSRWALNMASVIAEIFDAELILMRAIESAEFAKTVVSEDPARDIQTRSVKVKRLEAEQQLNMLKGTLPANLTIGCEVTLTEHIPNAINEMANARDVDLVVLSAHSDPGTFGWQRGSVPEFLLRYIDRPVLVFQNDENLAQNNFRSAFLPAKLADVS